MRKYGLGFTIVETLVVIGIIGVLIGLVIMNIAGSKEKTYYTRAQVELETLANATKLYVAKYGYYPPDAAEAGIPNEIMEFIAQGERSTQWPDGPWPGSKYDFEAWDIVKPGTGSYAGKWVYGTDGEPDTWQVSIRWCTFAEYKGPGGAALCAKRFPKQPWAAGFVSNNNALYYCIKGYCRSNGTWTPTTYPSYCLNCGTVDHKGITTDDGL